MQIYDTLDMQMWQTLPKGDTKLAKFNANDIQRPNLKASGVATVGIQQAIGGMSSSQAASMGPGQVGKIGAGKIAQEGQEIAQNVAQQNKVQGQRKQTGINKFSSQQKSDMNRRQDNSRRVAIDSRQRISAMGRDLDKKLFEDRMEFEQDARGIKFKNMRQLADFKKLVAKDDEEYATFAQDMQQRSQEKRKLLQIAHTKITQALTQLSKARESEANFEQKKKLIRAEAALKKKLKAEAASAKNNAMIWQGVGMVAGAAIGSVVPVVGTAAGAAIGGSVGQMGAAATS